MEINHQLRILLAEDDPNLGLLLSEFLKKKGFDVTWAQNGDQALDFFVEGQFDLCLLDVMMPKKDGFSLAKDIRANHRQVAIIFLTAKAMETDTLQGFKLGADDYLTKPFDLEELLIRIKKLLIKRDKIRSTEKALPVIFNFGQNWINFDSHQAKGVDGLIDLTKKETLLLKLLIENKNSVVSREHILKVVWDYNVIPNTRTVDNFMLSLRKYFETDPKNPIFLHSSRGIGYKFVEQATVVA